MRILVLLSICLGLAVRSFGQADVTLSFAAPTVMPSDRAGDSYAIYSQLLDGIPIDMGMWTTMAP